MSSEKKPTISSRLKKTENISYWNTWIIVRVGLRPPVRQLAGIGCLEVLWVLWAQLSIADVVSASSTVSGAAPRSSVRCGNLAPSQRIGERHRRVTEHGEPFAWVSEGIARLKSWLESPAVSRIADKHHPFCTFLKCSLQNSVTSVDTALLGIGIRHC